MKVLSDEQRARLLKALEDAPDEVLCDAVAEMKRVRVAIQDGYRGVEGYIGRGMQAAPTPAPAPAPAPVEVPALAAPSSKPETPPGKACSRAGSDTVSSIKAKCMRPSTAEEINAFLKRGKNKLDDTISILKLLWDRGQLVYENKTYRNK